MRLDPSPSGHFMVSNSCGQITYQQHLAEEHLDAGGRTLY